MHGRRQRDGEGRWLRSPLSMSSAGDTVLFGKYSGQEITLDGTEYSHHA